MALWTIDENPAVDSTLNLRAEPWADRLAQNGDSSLLFSSYAHGDPFTPLPQAYAGDPFVIRTINVSDSVDTLHVDGSRFFLENRFEDPDHPGERAARPLDTIHYGISERFSLIAKGGAGGPLAVPGDYLYMNAHRPSLPSGRLGHHPRPARPHCEPAAAAGSRGAGLDASRCRQSPADDRRSRQIRATRARPWHRSARIDISAVDVPKSAFGNQLRAAFVPSNMATQVEKKARRARAARAARRGRHVHHGALLESPHRARIVPLRPALGLGQRQHRLRLRLERHRRGLRARADGGARRHARLPPVRGHRQARRNADLRLRRRDRRGRREEAWRPTSTPGRPACTARSSSRRPAPPSPSPSSAVRSATAPRSTCTCPELRPTATSPLLMQDEDEDIGQSHMPYPTEVKGMAPINYRQAPVKTSTSDGGGRIRRDEQRPERHPGHADPQGLRGRPGAGARTRDARQRADARVQPRRRVVAARSVHRRLQPDAGPRDRPVGDAAGHDPRWGRRRSNRRRPVLRRPAPPVHRRRHVGHPARDVGRDLPDQAARQPRLHRQLGRVHHARRDARPQPSSPRPSRHSRHRSSASSRRRRPPRCAARSLPPARGGQAIPVRVAPVARCKPATRGVAGRCSPKRASRPRCFSDRVRPLPAPGAGR